MLKFRLLKSESGIRGSAWNRSKTTKSANSTTPAAMISGMVIGPQIAPQLKRSPSTSPKMMPNRLALANRTPTMSSRCRRPGRRSGTTRSAPASATNPTGTLTKKIQRQLM